MAFAADITGHINSLNLKLKGEENLISNFFYTSKGLQAQTIPITKQIQVMNLTHFKNCTKAMVEANTDFSLSIARGIIEELRDLLICMQKKMS